MTVSVGAAAQVALRHAPSLRWHFQNGIGDYDGQRNSWRWARQAGAGTTGMHKTRLPRINHEFITNKRGICAHVCAEDAFEAVTVPNDLHRTHTFRDSGHCRCHTGVAGCPVTTIAYRMHVVGQSAAPVWQCSVNAAMAECMRGINADLVRLVPTVTTQAHKCHRC